MGEVARVGEKMVALICAMDAMADREYARAGAIHGKEFASSSEGFGVIAEEVQEAHECMEMVGAVMHQLLKAIRSEDAKAIRDVSVYIRENALSGAAELIQVAAMCKKMVHTLEVLNEEPVQA